MKHITFLPLALLLAIGTISTSACSEQVAPAAAVSKVTELVKTDVKLGTGRRSQSGPAGDRALHRLAVRRSRA